MSAVTKKYEEIEDAALRLTSVERSRLATRILESLDDEDYELSDEWRDELHRRVAEIDAGNTVLISADEVWKTE